MTWFGSVTDKSGNLPQSVTFGRIRRSPSTGPAGHVSPDSAVTLLRNTQLHREHASKTDVRIIDFVDTGYPALLRMWNKRQQGYRVMGRVDSGAPAVGSFEW